MRTIAVAALCALAPHAGAQEVVVRLASEQRAYQQALEGFQKEFGRDFVVRHVARGEEDVPPEARVVVAFGGRAALLPVPGHARLVYALAPGVSLTSRASAGLTQVFMSPRPERILAKIKELQPSLERLAVLWHVGSFEPSIRDYVKAGEALGIRVDAERLQRVDDLPERLRALAGKTDAIWLLADPLLVNASNLEVIKQFSWQNRLPFYAPASTLLPRGAVASIGTSFADVGRAAARVARDSLSGRQTSSAVYPDGMEVSINRKAATETGVPAAAPSP